MLSCFNTRGQVNTSKVHQYEYSKINTHPRLLLNIEDEIAFNKAKFKVKEYAKIDNFNINSTQSILNTKEPFVFEMQVHRLLAVSRIEQEGLYCISNCYRRTKDIKNQKRAVKELNAVCDFKTWNQKHFLDVIEMSLVSPITDDWLYDNLQENNRIKFKKALVEKAIKPSSDKEKNWFYKKNSKWNSICNTGLIYGALGIFDDEIDNCISKIERALESNIKALSAYSPDGNYPKVPTYWGYGTSFEIMLIEGLKTALRNDKGFTQYTQYSGFINSAYFSIFTNGPSEKYFNYSYSGRVHKGHPTLYWFAKEPNDTSLITKELQLINVSLYTNYKGLKDKPRTLANVIIFDKNLNLTQEKLQINNIYIVHGITPVTIARTDWNKNRFKYFGIKGGKASNPHGHMDQGTFVYNIDELCWTIDFGSQSYYSLESKRADLWATKQNSQRWNILRYNNLNHNTITINNQRHNVNESEEIIETFYNKNEFGAKFELTKTLDLNNKLKSATRKAILVHNSYFKIKDIIEPNFKDVTVRWKMVTNTSAKILGKNKIRLS